MHSLEFDVYVKHIIVYCLVPGILFWKRMHEN